MSYLILVGFNYLYENVSDYFIRFVGSIGIYYNQLYFYVKANHNTFTINRICSNNRIIHSIPVNNMNNVVEIEYSYKNRTYASIYYNEIVFPPYNNLTQKPFDNTDDSIILITLDPEQSVDNDKLLTIVKKLSGPKGNFYKDTNHPITKGFLINYINNRLGYHISGDVYIEILYSNSDILLL